MPRLSALLALGLALITSTLVLHGCTWVTAHEAQLEALGCDMARVADLAPDLESIACLADHPRVAAAVTEAARTSPSAAPSAILAPVHVDGRLVAHVPRHLAPRVRELLALASDAGAEAHR